MIDVSPSHAEYEKFSKTISLLLFQAVISLQDVSLNVVLFLAFESMEIFWKRNASYWSQHFERSNFMLHVVLLFSQNICKKRVFKEFSLESFLQILSIFITWDLQVINPSELTVICQGLLPSTTLLRQCSWRGKGC